MKLFIITSEDPLYIRVFFETFFKPPHNPHYTVVGCATCRTFNEPKVKTLLRALKLFGIRDTLRQLWRQILLTTRGQTVSAVFRSAGVQHTKPKSVNDPEFIDVLRALKPDVILSVAAPERFEKQLLTIPRLASINVHSGRLPEYRGMMPVFWQLHDNRSEIAITVHTMSPRLDIGKVIATTSYQVENADTLHTVIIKTKTLGALLTRQTLERLALDQNFIATAPDMDESRATYHTFPTRADTMAFLATGRKLL